MRTKIIYTGLIAVLTLSISTASISAVPYVAVTGDTLDADNYNSNWSEFDGRVNQLGLVINATNINTISLPVEATNIRIQGDILLTNNLIFPANSNSLAHRITGGKISGTNGTEIINAKLSIYEKVEFSNIVIESPDEVIFIDCIFSGNNVTLPNRARIRGGTIQATTITVPIGNRLEIIQGAKISNTIINGGVNAINDSDIDDSQIGSEESPINLSLAGNVIDDTVFFISGDSFVSSNQFEDSTLAIRASFGGLLAITSNRFNDASNNNNSVIDIVGSGTAFSSSYIANNTFVIQSDETAIKINGSVSGNKFLTISGNYFHKGVKAIDNLGSGLDIVAVNNILNDVSIGISSINSINEAIKEEGNISF